MSYRLLMLIILLPLLQPLQSPAQVSTEELRVLKKLDSISASTSRAAPFAELYFNTMINSLQFFKTAEDSSRACIRSLQAQFTRSFFAAADSFAAQKEIPASWKTYYEDSSASGIRHVLLGINAHINGDIWPALITSFSYRELISFRPLYFSYYQSLLGIYDQVYDEVFRGSRSLRLLHSASIGADKWYGKKLLYRWLKRQMKLACLYYSKPDRFSKKLEQLHRKMQRLNRAIIRHF
ncbi:DUF5995 family protein [Terrimonas sp. NA20]|uniref:DUF5995 family protein n=1 Tax=Terrimonas ginsenosidimutans TaxID=2908004 RepID=A0ABS9KWL0_9BACT|nr:DUF5995 family protein [Terrimonas ginsenosidimutans]MCG2616700.1 DUF5995 family protein [Terrimonas ginsenosidimutans]